ncbi:MAG: hypothetical protein KJ630_05215, partial [Proteobacteria bacterium]|nr:hypothetical protein [Pseudomonadota bacterium]
DIPMVLDAYAGYYDYFSSFYKAINYPEELVGEKYPIPPQQDRHSVEEIISKIAFKNPMKYHFGIVC